MLKVGFGIAGIGLGASLIAASVVFLLLALLAPRKNKSTREIPPGPKRNLLGHTLSFPRDHFYDTFSEWNRQFGDVVYANFLGRSSFIISSREKAEELLSKRGVIYSNRPPRVLAQKLMGWAGWNVALLQPGKQHAELRGLLLKGLSPSMVISYDPLVERVIETQVLRPLAQSGPGGCDPAVFIGSGIASILMEVAYGDSLTEEQRNELLHANQKAVRAALKMNSISALLIDTFPILQYYPSWLPGGGFQKWATDCRVDVEHVRYRPWESVVRDTNLGIKRNSLVSRLVELNGPTDAVRDAVAFMFAAGAETTTTAIIVGVFMLLMYPDVQAKAHAEFDALIGHDRPPTPEDRLPYIEAVWKEVLRWHTPAPLGVPHVSSQEDVWDGYHIPQGATIFANIGAMLHDPQIWDNPEIFDPDRFLNVKPGTYDPQSVVFGFGRRLCPGKALADRNGFNFLIAILWAFHIDPLLGEERPTPVTAKFIDAAASPPVPFRCVFTPRSERIAMTCMTK